MISVEAGGVDFRASLVKYTLLRSAPLEESRWTVTVATQTASEMLRKMSCLTNDEGLFECCPGDVVPRRPASCVDGSFTGVQKRRLRLGVAGGAFPW